MQRDMHFYGTYAIARAAGIPQQDSETIAYAAQFVDDSKQQDSTPHEDGGLLYGIATAHHLVETGMNAFVDQEEQRRVWVPFHFIPGGDGTSLEEKLLCVKDSKIANEMMEHHIEYALGKPSFGLHLLGIGAHVYMDTFSHYGFSGVSSAYNKVEGGSIVLVEEIKDSKIKARTLRKFKGFFQKQTSEIVSFFGEIGSIGHGGVATYPDRPFLHWKVKFDKSRPGNGRASDRDNPVTYLEGCRKLHAHLSRFANKHYPENHPVSFDDIKEKVDVILRFEEEKEKRIQKWLAAIQDNALFQSVKEDAAINYQHNTWEDQKKSFHNLSSSSKGLDTDAYRFHQAAALHRYYVLKELLPGHGIAVY